MNRRQFSILTAAAFTGCGRDAGPTPAGTPAVAPPPLPSFGTPQDSAKLKFERIELPSIPNAAAIWGGTGRDDTGTIYLGLCTEGDGEQSAHLIAYDPASKMCRDLGGVVEQLRRNGRVRPGDRQQKIHTKILQAKTGELWFASMDEFGENEDGSKLPTFGSHVWSLEPKSGNWTLHLSTPEALIAAAGPDDAGNFFFLGYFGHVLYRVHPSGDVRRIEVGSVGGHVSRNLVWDRNTVFVPRVNADGATLVGYDASLLESSTFPLRDYSTTPNASSHGISSWAKLKDGVAIVSDRGRLSIRTNGGFEDAGWMHPAGACYTPCLFSPDGATQLLGLGYRDVRARQYEWMDYDLKTRTAKVLPATPSVPAGAEDLLLYGSSTTDPAGHFYAVGRYMLAGRSVPVAYVVS
jgi:hypothetical protein